MKGVQRGTYLRLTRALSGPWVSVAKTYRDETKTKMNISARSQWPSSAVEYKRLIYSTAEEYSFQFLFHLYISQRRLPADRTMLSSVLGKCCTAPLPYLFVEIQELEIDSLKMCRSVGWSTGVILQNLYLYSVFMETEVQVEGQHHTNHVTPCTAICQQRQ